MTNYNHDDLVDAALDWAELGIGVFPCSTNKRPITPNGFYAASTDQATIEAMFDEHKGQQLYVGGRMGKESGVFALDLDLYKGESPKAYYGELKNADAIPETQTHHTKNGGLHLLYRSATEWPNFVPCAGVEVKGEGGYIILPPSEGYSASSVGIADAPAALMKVLSKGRTSASKLSVDDYTMRVVKGEELHDSLRAIAAKYSTRGTPILDVLSILRTALDASVASDPAHERHARWFGLRNDVSGELTRIVSTGNDKFNPVAKTDKLKDVMQDKIGTLESVASSVGFLPPPKDEEPPTVKQVVDYDVDVNPFHGSGYFAGENHDLLDQKFIMHPVYAEDEVILLYADPKTGKTALNVTASLHTACGMDFGDWKVHEARPCLYFALEGSRAIKMRIQAWREYMVEQEVEIPDDIPMFVVEQAANFIKEDERNAVCNQIIAMNNYCVKRYGKPLGIISLDTLTRAMSGGDQNSVADTSSLFELVALLRNGGITASIVLVHHKGKAGNIRGSSNLEAEPDLLMDVSKNGENIQARVAAARSIEEGGMYNFRTVSRDLGITKQGIKLTSFIVEAIDSVSPDGDDYADAVNGNKAMTIITEMGVGEHSITDVAAKLFAAKLLSNVGSSRRVPSATSTIVQGYMTALVDNKGRVFSGSAVTLAHTNGRVSSVIVKALA